MHLMGVRSHLIYCLNKLKGHKSKYVSCITSTERYSPGWFSHTGVPQVLFLWNSGDRSLLCLEAHIQEISQQPVRKLPSFWTDCLSF